MKKVIYINQDPKRANQRAIEAPTREQRSHEEYHQDSEGTYRRTFVSVLEKLATQRHSKDASISKEQYDAGNRLFEDAYFGGVISAIKGVDPTRALMPRSKSWAPKELSERQALSHRRWSQAYFNERLGNAERDILWWVCIMNMGTSSFSDNRGYAIGTLRTALNELVRYYKS